MVSSSANKWDTSWLQRKIAIVGLDCDQLTISLHFWSRQIKCDLIFSPYRVQIPLPGGA